MRRALRRAGRLGHSLFSGLRVSQVTGLSTGLFLDLDARHDVTLSGSDVTDWADGAGTANDFAEATNMPAYSAVSSNWGGRPAITYTAANTDSLTSADAASTWTFLHDGTGCTMAAVIYPTATGVQQQVFGTRNSNASGIAQSGWNYDGTNQRIQIVVSNGTNFIFGGVVTGNGTALLNTRMSIVVTWLRSGGTNTANIYILGEFRGEFTSSEAPSTSDPAFTARIGWASNGGLNPYNGDINAVHVWTRYFTAADAALYHQWAIQNWGV